MFESYSDTVTFNIHVFPLPYHTWSFMLSKAAHVVEEMSKDEDDIWSFMDYCFDHQNEGFEKIVDDDMIDETDLSFILSTHI